MSLTPKDGHVIVQRVDADNKTKSGIYIPETAQDKKAIGNIISIGYNTLGLEVDDTIAFLAFAGTEIEHEFEKYLIISEDDILVKIEEKA